MNKSDVEDLLDRVSTWPGDFTDADRKVWSRTLWPLDAHMAGKVLDQMFASLHFRPTEAEFHALYRKTDRRERGSEGCAHCNNSHLTEMEDGSFRPCGHCNPEGYAKWQAGGFRLR